MPKSLALRCQKEYNEVELTTAIMPHERLPDRASEEPLPPLETGKKLPEGADRVLQNLDHLIRNIPQSPIDDENEPRLQNILAPHDLSNRSEAASSTESVLPNSGTEALSEPPYKEDIA